MNDLQIWSGGDASLPTSYRAACQALAQCDLVDECKDWSDRAAALAAYARQANDETLLNHARRIQARAVRRAGELLKQIDARPTNAAKQTDGTGSLISQRQVAADAGMSERQQVTAVRVANVPTLEFEAQVESEKPPTVTALAGMGTLRRPQSPIVVQVRDIPSVKILTAADRHDQIVLQKLVEARHRLLGVTDDRLTMAITFIDSAIRAIEHPDGSEAQDDQPADHGQN